MKSTLTQLQQYCTHNREPFFKLAAQHVVEKTVVLDVGAGDGEFKKYVPTADYIAVEGNPSTATKLRQAGIDVIEARVPSTFPLKDQTIDTIHCSHLVEHLEPKDLLALLFEFDRVLKNGGRLAISAPLLWSGFYNDLSHVRPYSPQVFQNYLSSGGGQRTAQCVSTKYRTENLTYRYHPREIPHINLSQSRSLLKRVAHSIILSCRNRQMWFYEETGFTLVLQKTS